MKGRADVEGHAQQEHIKSVDSLVIKTDTSTYLHRSTTTESALAGMKPRRKTLRQPQL